MAQTLGMPSAAKWVRAHTGFTDFYNPFRNAAGELLTQDRARVLPLVRDARQLRTDEEGACLVRALG